MAAVAAVFARRRDGVQAAVAVAPSVDEPWNRRAVSAAPRANLAVAAPPSAAPRQDEAPPPSTSSRHLTLKSLDPATGSSLHLATANPVSDTSRLHPSCFVFCRFPQPDDHGDEGDDDGGDDGGLGDDADDDGGDTS